MKVEIKRAIETPLSIISNIFVDGQWEAWGLEPARINPAILGHPAIPAGTYNVIFSPSPHLGYVTPEVLGVAGRSEIRWHIGNFPKDTLGCVLIGQMKATDKVLNSKDAFDALMTLLRTATDGITAIYTDPA